MINYNINKDFFEIFWEILINLLMKQKIKKSNNLSEKQENVNFIIFTYNILIKYFQKSELFFSTWKHIQNKSFKFFVSNFKVVFK